MILLLECIQIQGHLSCLFRKMLPYRGLGIQSEKFPELKLQSFAAAPAQPNKSEYRLK